MEEDGQKVFNHTAHKALWQWLSEKPGKEKWEWPGWIDVKDVDMSDYGYCFACQAADDSLENPCPLEHEYVDCSTGECLNGLYIQWRCAKGRERATLARQIRDLPVREGVKCI